MRTGCVFTGECACVCSNFCHHPWPRPFQTVRQTDSLCLHVTEPVMYSNWMLNLTISTYATNWNRKGPHTHTAAHRKRTRTAHTESQRGRKPGRTTEARNSLGERLNLMEIPVSQWYVIQGFSVQIFLHFNECKSKDIPRKRQPWFVLNPFVLVVSVYWN